MPRTTKTLDEQLEETRRRLADLARRKRLKEAEERKQERRRRQKQDELIGRLWQERHEALAARDAAAGEREWQEMVADMDSFLQLPSERRVFGLEKLDAEKAAVKEEPKPVRIWKDYGAVRAKTPHRSGAFATGIRALGGGWADEAKKRYWYASAAHYDEVVALAQRCYEKVVELEQPPTD